MNYECKFANGAIAAIRMMPYGCVPSPKKFTNFIHDGICGRTGETLYNKASYTNIYLIECDGFYKIGVAKNINARLSALQIGTPYKLNLIGSIEHVKWLEHILHGILSFYHTRGEWFRLVGITKTAIIDLFTQPHTDSILDEIFEFFCWCNISKWRKIHIVNRNRIWLENNRRFTNYDKCHEGYALRMADNVEKIVMEKIFQKESLYE
jgi:hypothetical protein